MINALISCCFAQGSISLDLGWGPPPLLSGHSSRCCDRDPETVTAFTGVLPALLTDGPAAQPHTSPELLFRAPDGALVTMHWSTLDVSLIHWF